MKRILLLLLLSSSLFAQFQSGSESLLRTDVKSMSMGSSDITNKATYTTFDHARIPIGIMEYETVKTRFKIGYRRMMLKNLREGTNIYDKDAINAIDLPMIRIGTPDKIYFDINYSMNPITSTQDNSDGKQYTKTKPLSRFGAYLMGQMPDGRVRLGLGGQLYLGRETWSANESSRLLMGAEDIGIMMSFNLHEAVNLTFSGHCSAFYDSLYVNNQWSDADKDLRPQERFAWLQLPQINVALDIGQHDLPYLGNIAITYAKNHFVYTVKGDNSLVSSGLSSSDDLEDIANGKMDPIKKDSLGLHIKNMWLADLGDAGEIRPALSFGLSHIWSKHMYPGADNWPIAYNHDGDSQKGWEMRVGGINWGAGIAYSANDVVETWMEYQMATMSCSPNASEVKEIDGSEVDPQIYNKVGIGLKTNFDKYSAINMGDHTFYFLVGFLFRQENALYGTYRSWPLNHMYDLSVSNPNYNNSSDLGLGAEFGRYAPWEAMKEQVQTMNINFGLGATFAKKMVELDLTVGILNQKTTHMELSTYSDESTGVELGIDLTYNLQGKRKLASEKKVVEKEEEESDNTEEHDSNTPAEGSNGL